VYFASQEKLQPQSVNNTVNKVRAQLWDILNRLPHDATLQPYATQLVRLAMQMVQLENEDNAIICVRTIFDLHKVR
jgi:transformation/transcription domain-associated protein